MPDTPYFTRATFTFLKDLAAHNERAWFQANKGRYERTVKEPAMRFITDFARHLERISPHFRADPRPVGGSLFRIYRDTRFSKDKRPYKTHTGIQFRHERGRDAHAPGFYLHIEPGGCFAGMGSWHPDAAALRAIRERIAEQPEAWRKAVGGRGFRATLELAGESLTRPPRGFDAAHPLIEDLKRKDFIAVRPLAQSFVTSPDLPRALAKVYRAGAPLVAFICEAVGVPF